VDRGVHMQFGVDATHPATESLFDLSRSLLGEAPTFFGRYFKGPYNPSPIQYQPNQENPFLNAQHLRVLCIARQTNRVGGSRDDGVADAINNMSAIVDAFGPNYLRSLNYHPIVFLDTELSDTQPTLSADYFLGWAGALREQGPIAPGARLRFTPAIYINRSDDKAWKSLGKAIASGAVCHGAWVANYGRRTGAEPPPPWQAEEVSPKPPTVSPTPLLAWQYAGDYEDVLDFSVMPSDAVTEQTLSMMILPPGE
jgi:hypothetical protein